MQFIPPLMFIGIIFSLFIALLLLTSALILFCKYLNNQNKCCLTSSIIMIILFSIVVIIPISKGSIGTAIAQYQTEKLEIEILKNKGTEIIEQIELFKEENGNFPLELSAFVIEPQLSESENWKYQTYKNKNKYRLKIVNLKNKYILTWKSWKREWKISYS